MNMYWNQRRRRSILGPAPAGAPGKELLRLARLRGALLAGLAIILFCLAAAAAGEKDPSAIPLPEGPVVLEVRGTLANGNADGAALFDMEMLKALPVAQVETTTAVTDGVSRFDGFLLHDLLDLVGARGTTLTATALNDYSVDIAIEELERFGVLVAYAMDGVALLPSDKGPLWIVYPRDQYPELQDIRYDYRWVWQLRWLETR